MERCGPGKSINRQTDIRNITNNHYEEQLQHISGNANLTNIVQG
jgi:hypothetical protein